MTASRVLIISGPIASGTIGERLSLLGLGTVMALLLAWLYLILQRRGRSSAAAT
jgi:uncharacterized membrane protein YccC